MNFKVIFVSICIIYFKSVSGYLEFEVPRDAFDQELYENILDTELCEEQLRHIVFNNFMLWAQFMDAGIRTPKGILSGNLVDLGNYYKCLEIQEDADNLNIEGKYCMINVPLRQDNLALLSLPERPEWPELTSNATRNFDFLQKVEDLNAEIAPFRRSMDVMRVAEGSVISSLAFRLAICIPKTCTTGQALRGLLFNTTVVDLDYSDEYCRVKDDKPFAPGDYVALVIFGVIFVITLLSSCYDLHHTLILRKDPNDANIILLCKSFSLYTNTRRLLNFKSNPGALESVDGIRALAILWIIVGHSCSTQLSVPSINPIDMFSYITSFSATWIVAAPISVDTFFMLSGLLVVYTTVGKLSRSRLMKYLHLFYLNRLLRMFPILATGVLLQASLFNHISDGPEWHVVAAKVNRCRTYWWSTFTYLQTYITNSWCIGPTWYLAIDVQLHILSPIVLFWIFGKKRTAWIALSAALILSLVVSTVYNYINEFQSTSLAPSRPDDTLEYTKKYYINTLTRCTPFFVGMLFGYLLNVCKGKTISLPKLFVAFLWICTVVISSAIIYSSYPIVQIDWDNQFLDSFINSFMRPAWAMCLGWVVFACAHGYGGPVNWFLSLNLWKLPARISFAMYIFHYPLIIIVNSSAVTPTYFTMTSQLYRSLADVTMSLIFGFFVTLIIDSPFSTLIKMAIGGGSGQSGKQVIKHNNENNVTMNHA